MHVVGRESTHSGLPLLLQHVPMASRKRLGLSDVLGLLTCNRKDDIISKGWNTQRGLDFHGVTY